MRFKNIDEVLEWTGMFHAHLAREYQRLARRQDRQRLELLLQYLADHERLLQETLQRFREETSPRVLNTWFDKAPEIPLPGSLPDLRNLFQGDDTDTVVEAAVNFHDGVIDVYTRLRDQAPTEDIRDLFDNLVNLEHHETLKLVRGAQQLEDV